MKRRLVPWIPAIAAPALVAAAVGLANLPAQADIPAKTPAQVVALAASSTVKAFSGTLAQTSDLGLPATVSVPGAAGGAEAVPGEGGTAADAAQDLASLAASHTLRIYADGASRQRLQIFSAGTEEDVVHNGTSLWLYDAQTQTATHLTGTAAGAADRMSQAAPPTPQQIADEFLKTLAPTTRIAVVGTTKVAGRSAYELELQPKTDDTTIGQMRIAVDAANGMALSVTVIARNATSPAFTLAFTSLSLGAPPAARFDFTPPVGSHVQAMRTPVAPQSKTGDEPPMRLLGSSWTSVVEIPQAGTGLVHSSAVQELTSAAPGGRLFSSSLVNVYIADSGTVYAGAVTPSVLYAADAGR